MLLSMTGFGDARFQDQRWSIQVEVRTVNNRHLKLSAKISEPYTALEAELEHLVRERVRRGTVQISMRIDRPRQAEDYRLNTVALASYRDQLRALEVCGGGGGALDLGSLLVLPGVVEELRPTAASPHEDWPAHRRRGEPGARPPGGGPRPGRPVDGRGAEVAGPCDRRSACRDRRPGPGRGAIVPEAPHRACAVAGPRPRGDG